MEIYGTIGPACARVDTLRAMLELGMTGLRLNLSHTTLREAEPLLAMIDTAAREAGVKPRLLIDMQGPELRVGRLPAPLTLTEGETLRLGEGGLPVPEPVLNALLPGDRLLLDDGRLLLRVTAAPSCVVVRGGTLNGGKSVAVEGRTIPAPAMTDMDRENLRLAPHCGVTAVMQPFVRDPAELRTVRAAMDAAGGEQMQLMAKLESREGVERLTAFFGLADEIVIARGDLGNAMPLWELPGTQKRVAATCRERGVPFMVVTQLLASMERCAVPTRAEVSDIYNAVLDGASSVMVTGETAVGAYPVEVIRYLTNTVREALKARPGN